MRALLIVTGTVLWLSAFASRGELFEAWQTASVAFDAGVHRSAGVSMGCAFAAGVLALAEASPVWKLLTGLLFLKLSVVPTPSKPVDWTAVGAYPVESSGG